MQLSSLSLALTAAYGPGFAWRNFFTNNTPGFRINVEEAIRLNQQAMGPELVVGGYITPVGFDNVTTQTSSSSFTVASGSTVSRVAVPLVASGALNKTFVFSFRVTKAPASGTVQAYARTELAGGGTSIGMSPSITAAGVYNFQVTSSSDVLGLLFASSVNGSEFDVDRISVREIDLSKCVAFQDSAGTLPVVSMEQPLGLILDTKLGVPVRGVELVLNGTGLTATTNWVAQGGATLGVVSGALTVTGTAGARAEQYNRPVVANRWYELTVDVTLGSGVTTAQINFSKQSDGTNMALLDITSSGPKRFYALATESNAMFKYRISAGTGTVTFANISVRELAGNHFVQPSNTASRPIVSRRVNLLTATEDFSGSPWIAGRVSGVEGPTITPNTVAAPDGTMTADALDFVTNNGRFVRQDVSFPAGAQGTVSLWAYSPAVGGAPSIRITTNNTLGWNTGISQSFPLTAGWNRLTLSGTIISTGSTARILIGGATVDGAADPAVVGVAYVWGADLRLASDVPGLPSYQRVTSSTDYDEVGFPAYARADGLDDWLESGVVDMSGTDAVTVIAGVKKRSDAAAGVVVEFSTNWGSGTNQGGFGVFASTGIPAARYGSRSAATLYGSIADTPADFPAPHKALLGVVMQTTTDLNRLRVNGQPSNFSATDQGTGNYGAHKFYLLRRGGTSLPFNGRLYGVTVIGKLLTDGQLAAAEQAERQMGRLY